jgi:hypothetical protein
VRFFSGRAECMTAFEKKFPNLNYELFYNTCKVHFKRSLTRVKSSNVLVTEH